LAQGSISGYLQAEEKDIVLAVRNVGRRTRRLPYPDSVYVDDINLPKGRMMQRGIEGRGTLQAEFVVGEHLAGDIIPEGQPITRQHVGSRQHSLHQRSPHSSAHRACRLG
jgi:hypothetical protein